MDTDNLRLFVMAAGQRNISAAGRQLGLAPAVASSFAQLHVMPLLPEFHALYPDLTLDLRLSDTRFDAIEGSFDLALRSAPLSDSSLKGRKLHDDTRILCAAPDYLDRHGTPPTPAALASHRYIALSNLKPRALINATGERAVLDPVDMVCRAIVDDGDAQREATIAGAGLSINSLWSVAHDIKAGRLVHVLPDWRMNDRSVLWLVYPRSNVLTPKTRYFMDFLIARLGQRPPWPV